jgi:dual-specificity kinase
MRQQAPAGGESGLGVAGHASKKRKTGVSTSIYDPIHHAQFASSVAQTPVSAGSLAAATISTDRTASAINTTAPTSMSSHFSQAGASHEPYVAEVVGQKRKRTRQQAAEEARRLEPVQQVDPYVNYHPPPNPPIKAKDVYVTVVPEVRVNALLTSRI